MVKFKVKEIRESSMHSPWCVWLNPIWSKVGGWEANYYLMLWFGDTLIFHLMFFATSTYTSGMTNPLGGLSMP